MLFRKKNTGDDYSRRARQPVSGGATPVFSYHAQSARSEPSGGRPRVKLPWANSAAAKLSPRHDSRRAPKRVAVVAAVILVAALALNSLFLARNPAIVAHELPDGRQLLLRPRETYQEAAQAILSSSLANSNKITVNTTKLAHELQKQFPELGHVSVVLPFIGRQPVVHIQTVQPALLLVSSQTGGVFLLDKSGRAVMDAGKISASVKERLSVVQDESGLPVTVGDGALPSSNIDYITEVTGQLAAKGVKISSIVLPLGASELNIRIENAPYTVKFNLHGDARAGVGAFLAVKQQLERENKVPSSYIDVRVDNKAYYR